MILLQAQNNDRLRENMMRTCTGTAAECKYNGRNKVAHRTLLAAVEFAIGARNAGVYLAECGTWHCTTKTGGRGIVTLDGIRVGIINDTLVAATAAAVKAAVAAGHTVAAA